jgi:Mrp family chromosome partitioning ATPase
MIRRLAVDQAANLRRLVLEKKNDVPSSTRTIVITSGKGGLAKQVYL